MVAVRTFNTTRGLVKRMGTRLPKCSSPSFAQKVTDALPAEMREVLLPLVGLVAGLSEAMEAYDQRIEALASQKYGHTK